MGREPAVVEGLSPTVNTITFYSGRYPAEAAAQQAEKDVYLQTHNSGSAATHRILQDLRGRAANSKISKVYVDHYKNRHPGRDIQSVEARIHTAYLTRKDHTLGNVPLSDPST